MTLDTLLHDLSAFTLAAFFFGLGAVSTYFLYTYLPFLLYPGLAAVVAGIMFLK